MRNTCVLVVTALLTGCATVSLRQSAQTLLWNACDAAPQCSTAHFIGVRPADLSELSRTPVECARVESMDLPAALRTPSESRQRLECQR
ncbi:MAG: hypothetical protein V2I63_11435 [Pseudomonadales bacterium]|nr:hypothetical protein [Pseudomonadales bacterium]